MKIKSTIQVLIIFLTFVSYNGISQNKASNETKFRVDIEKSVLNWKGKKLVGYAHVGTLKLSKAELVVDGLNIQKSFFEIDMNSLLDDNAMKDPNNVDLTKHLKGEDFFYVEKYPFSSIKITGAQPIVDNPDAGDRNYILTGDLTIRGITHKIGFPATILVKDNLFEMKATIVFDRSKWDVKFGSGSFFDNLGDNMISDDIEVNVELIAKAI